jgi:hypothetical protein
MQEDPLDLSDHTRKFRQKAFSYFIIVLDCSNFIAVTTWVTFLNQIYFINLYYLYIDVLLKSGLVKDIDI